MMRPEFNIDEGIMRRDARDARIKRMRMINMAAASRKTVERNPDSAAWFCLHVDTGHETAVEKRLADADIETLLPMDRSGFAIRKGKKLQLPERPFFPGYVFVRCVPSAEAFQALTMDRDKTGVRCIVGGPNGYHQIRAEDISIFKQFCENPQIPLVATDKSFKQGDRADIEAGPFAGFMCQVLSVKWSREARARVSIGIEGRQFEIESMPLAFLKKL